MRKEPMRKIFAILGKASAGKDSLANALQEEIDYPMAVSFTTRPMRANEKQGVQYNFISREKFEWYKDVNMLAEYTNYDVAGGDTWYYGLTKRELEKGQYVLVIVNPHGLRQLKEVYGDKVCSILVDADAKTRIIRYLNRDASDEQKVEECCRRFLADQQDFRNVDTDYVINNNEDFKIALYNFKTIIRNEVSRDLLKKVNEDFTNNPLRFIGGTHD